MPELLEFNSDDPEEGEDTRNSGYATGDVESVLDLCKAEEASEIFDFSYFPLLETSLMTAEELALLAANGSVARITYVTKS